MSSRKGLEGLEAFAKAVQAKLISLDFLRSSKYLYVFIGEEGSDQVTRYQAQVGSSLWRLLTSKNPSITWDPRKEILWVALLKTQTKTKSVLVLLRPPIIEGQKVQQLPQPGEWIRVKEYWNLSENL